MKLDFGSGHRPQRGYMTCDCTGSPGVDYYFNPVKYRVMRCRPNSFSTIRCRNVLHHVPDIKKLFIEFARILRPNGYLVIIEPSNSAYPANHFLDTLWYRGIIPRREVWFSPQWREYRKYLTESQMSVIFESASADGTKDLTVAKKL